MRQIRQSCILFIITIIKCYGRFFICAYQVFQRLFAPYLFAGCYQSSCIAMSSLPSSFVAQTTATSASDPLVWFHGNRGENVWSLLGAWHRGKRSVLEIGDQIETKISPPPEGSMRVSRSPTSGPPWPLIHQPHKGHKNWTSHNWQRISSLQNPGLFPSGHPIAKSGWGT